MSVSVIVRVFELVKCLLRMHSSSWIHTEVSGIKHAHRPTHRWTIEILQAHTLALTHPHTPSSCDDEECEAWLFVASPLSDLYLHNNQLTDLPSGVFSNLSSLRFESEWECACLSLSGILSHFLGCFLLWFISYHFLFFGSNRSCVYALLMCAYTWQNVSVNVHVLYVPLSWYLINVPLFFSVCVFVLL